MAVSTIDAGMVQKAFLAAAKGLEAKKEWINELNVFPVPDGDTGTNMTLTIMAAAREVAKLDSPSMAQLAKAISSGSLRGARGNSGVILSQLLRGFTKEVMDVEAIDTRTLANAMMRGTETAYKAVMKPKEGTILTVAKRMADKALELAPQTDDILAFAAAVIEEGDAALAQTPELLPVLKQAGVVDSGGQGLMQVVKGAYQALTGEVTDVALDSLGAPEKPGEGTPLESRKAAPREIDTAAITYGYCTEFIINLEKPFTEAEESELKSYLSSIGDSLVVVADDEVVKVHVHTNHPGLAFEKGLSYGSLSRMKVDNMREEQQERVIQGAEALAREQAQAEEQAGDQTKKHTKAAGFIAVVSGDGLSEIFKGIGADCLIEGGQTMNPSTEELLKAIERVSADTVFILPNNKNIIMAAQQARDLTEDKKVYVVPSQTIPQGITALVNFIPDMPAQENLENMIREMKHVKTAQITYAVRSTTIDGREIREGDIMAVGDEGILASGSTIEGTALDAIGAMMSEGSELATIYYGKDVEEQNAAELEKKARALYPDTEFELQYGGQPIYYYMISVE